MTRGKEGEEGLGEGEASPRDPQATLRHNFNSLIVAMRCSIGYFKKPEQFRELLGNFIPPIEQLREGIGGIGYKDNPTITREKLDALLLKLNAINPEVKIPTQEDIDTLQQSFIKLFGYKGFFKSK